MDSDGALTDERPQWTNCGRVAVRGRDGRWVDLGEACFTATPVEDEWIGTRVARVCTRAYATRVIEESTVDGDWHYGPDPGHGGLTKHHGTRANCSGPDCVDDTDWTDEADAAHEEDEDDDSWRFGPCEASRRVESDHAGKPVAILCRRPGEHRTDVGSFGFGAVVCDECYEELRWKRGRVTGQ